VKFLRFGELPSDGKSFNYKDRYAEKGISCIPYKKKGNKHLIDFTDISSSAFFIGGFHKRAAYILEGDIVGRGSDNEPLIKNAKIIQPLKKGQKVWNNSIFCEKGFFELVENPLNKSKITVENYSFTPIKKGGEFEHCGICRNIQVSKNQAKRLNNMGFHDRFIDDEGVANYFE
jgi:hypothetical protein